MPHTDICIAGAGVIGLSLALELQARNLSVTVVETGHPLREASWAAAGMLAAHDPHNPAELLPLSELSVALYPEFLERLESLGGAAVPFQTSHTIQSTTSSPMPVPTASFDSPPKPLPNFDLLDEHSIDPRQLAPSLFAAIAGTPIRLLTESPVLSTRCASGTVQITTPTHSVEAAHFIDCTGAWASDSVYQVVPIKGQMLSIALPSHFQMKIALRTADVYIVPRTIGPSAGHAVIGATVEDLGFDKIVYAAQIEDLRQQAIALLPQLAQASIIDSWSGLRPSTPDRLPILGAHPSRQHHWVATGHYRNGILLAPATAHSMAQLLLGEDPSTPLDNFAPSRPSLRCPTYALPRP